MNRRMFMASAAGAVAASTVFPKFSIGNSGASANSKINLALVGSGGWIAQQPMQQGCAEENLVAFCDVDRDRCAENMKSWRNNEQPFYEDYREMFDKMHKEIDAVVISTPDHTHFPATLAAMERGIHVYTQKPLTHNIWQARTLEKARKRYKVMTQMGNQGHSSDSIRKSVEAYRAGVIGDVSEIYARNDGPQIGNMFFDDVKTMPPPESPIPDGFDWDKWLGPAAMRPFYEGYIRYKWRTFWDFGLGMLGDFGCHTLDTPVWALELEPPTVVECLDRKESLKGVIPPGSRLKFEFPAKGKRGPVTLYWFDGPQDWGKVGQIQKFGADNALFYGKHCWMVGSKGMIGCGTHAGGMTVIPDEVRGQWSANPPKETIPRIEGGPFREWLRAIKGTGPEPGSNFSYSSKLTEIILLGALAQRFNKRIEWDAKKGRITNHPELNAFVKEPVRKGWEFGESL